ncbi:MAG: prenyltransferase [Anaerolineales bacterium]|jgi:1,4-dihydroxy-2-naphthoate octaprenyltransferase
MSLLKNWKTVLDTANLPPDRHMDWVSRWLIITRAAVFSMTLMSGLIGGLLAAAIAESVNWWYFGIALVGLVLAHAANNMVNDYFDMEQGVDTDEYARAQYAPHPVLAGLISKRGLLLAVLIVNLIDALILLFFIFQVGWPVLVFALLGLFISVFYVAPPLKLKHHGLGEPGVFVVWGPLMIGGTYYVTAGVIPPLGVWLACIPYALIVTTVLIGKHIDKNEADREKGIHTLPVIFGTNASRWLNIALMVVYYLVVFLLVGIGTLGVWVLLIVFALPRLVRVLKIYRQPPPTEPPPDFPVWPLWYVAAAFYHNKLAGGLFVLGLILNLIFPITFSFLG